MALPSHRLRLRLRRPYSSLPPLSCSSGGSSSRGRISLYHPALRPLLAATSMREVLEVQAHLTTTGLLRDPFAASRAIKSAALLCPLPYSLLLLSHLPNPDHFSFNTLLRSISLSPNPGFGLPFFFRSLSLGFAPNSYSFPPLAHACARIPCLHRGELCHAQALKRGADRVVQVRNALLHMYACCGLVSGARALFDETEPKDLVSWNSIIDGYAMFGDLVAARQMFDAMPERNVISWNVMIGGYLKGRSPDCGLALFREMMAESGVKVSVKMMVNVVTACGRAGALRQGWSVHGYFIKNFEGSNLIFETALVDMYSKCKRVNMARRVFDVMTERNLICWNAMVLGHCIHGCADDGLALFNEMVERGSKLEAGGTDDSLEAEPTRISPDEVTFVGVLCACARAGLLTEGKKYFEQMTSVYKIMPTFAHYWCMANLYGGLGLVQEAEEVLKNMPEDTESFVWSGLLGSCRFRGDMELGEHIGKRLIELEPYNSSRYVLLWNIYVSAGRWEDIHKLKGMMKERGVRVIPGHSLLDLKEIVHNFKAGDRSQPEMEKIYVMMDDLAARLKLTDNLADSSEGGGQC